jgi:hypothetical protein
MNKIMTFYRHAGLQIAFRVFMQFSRRALTGVYVNVGLCAHVKPRFITTCLQHSCFLFQFLLYLLNLLL